LPFDGLAMIFSIIALLISGFASPFIFVPCFAIGWFARRWWQLPIGAIAVEVISVAEVMLIEMPDAQPDWSLQPLAFVPPLFWCAAGFLMRRWRNGIAQSRAARPISALPVVAGMVLGALAVGASAFGVGLLYLRTDQLDFHIFQLGQADPSGYEAIFFEYLFPGVLAGQVAGGLIGRMLGRPIRPPAAQQPTERAALSV
jgi:hypothetical protein